MLPSDYPISHEPSRKLLDAVMNYYFCEVKIYYSECVFILLDRSYDCLMLFKYKNIVFKSYLSWKKNEFFIVYPILYIFYKLTFFYCSFKRY